jgi:AcrR family transcriptional regulator
MTSQRHIAQSGGRVDDDALLDAARGCVLDVGFRRTTLTDVARRAGVSRMTLYRRFADVRSLVADLMTREFTELLRRAAEALPSTGSHRERLVARATASVSVLWTNPLMARVLDVDPELLLPYVVDRVGATQRLVEPALRADVEAGQADGSIRAGDPILITRALYLVLQAFVLSARPALTDLGGGAGPARAALLDELATLLHGALRPAEPPTEPTTERPAEPAIEPPTEEDPR